LGAFFVSLIHNNPKQKYFSSLQKTTVKYPNTDINQLQSTDIHSVKTNNNTHQLTQTQPTATNLKY